MSDRGDSNKLCDFPRVFAAELTEIEALRQRRASTGTPFKRGDGNPAVRHGLVGLAISGGGIRSSTFALGVIQALEANGVLKAVDYMSTVSGGGFVGSCLSSLLNDARFDVHAQTPPAPFPLAAETGAGESRALVHLRNKSKYLAPGGVLDKLRIPALLLRGTLDNFAIFLFIIMLAVTATQICYQLAWESGYESAYFMRGLFVAFIIFPLAYAAFLFMWRLLATSTWKDRNRAETAFGLWLAVLIAILVLIPLDAFLNHAVEATWADLRNQFLDKLHRPFDAADRYKWLGAGAVLLGLLFAARVSQRVSTISGKLVLLGIGILGPAILFMVYLGLVVIELDSPIVRPKPLFTLTGSDVDNMASPAALKKLKEQFAARWRPLTDAAYIHTAEPLRRWVIHDVDSAYSVARRLGGGIGSDGGNDTLDVAQDFEFLLDRCTVSPDLRDTLAEQGHAISKHPNVTSGRVPDALQYRTAADALRKDFACAGNEPKAGARQGSAGAGEFPQWPGIARKAPTGEDVFLWGNQALAVVHDQNAWKLVQVVHPSLVREALRIAASPVELLTRDKLETLIQDTAGGSDDELDAARRFVNDATSQQDLLIVIDTTVAGAIPDPRAVLAAAVLNAGNADAYPEGRKTMRVAFLEIDLSGVPTSHSDFRSPDTEAVVNPGEPRACAVRTSPGFPANAANPDGSTALISALTCATKFIDRDGREGAQKSILFIGAVAGRSGQQADEFARAVGVPWSRFHFYVADLARDVANAPLTPTIASQALQGTLPKLPMPFKSLAETPGGRYIGVGKGASAETELRDFASQVITRLAKNSPQRESFRLRKNKNTTYTLYREGKFVRLEAEIEAAPPQLDAASQAVPEELREFFKHAGGIKLSPRARIVPPAVTATEKLSGSRDICADPHRGERLPQCWRIEDPYLFRINRVAGGLRVLDQRKAQPLLVPANIVAIATEPDRGLSWNDFTVKVPWILVLGFLWVYWCIYDVNSTTLHRFYRDRLSRAFLIKLPPRGKEGDLSNDRLKLSELNHAGTAPYHLINVAINLESSNAEDLRGRGADFFLFSKCFVGSQRLGFVATKVMEKYDRQLDLATAMAISGGAAAPSMGTTTIKPLVFIMTLLNIRLNYWLPNPRFVAKRYAVRHLRGGPGPFYLLREALGWLDECKPYVNISDGGHIENLGIYELLRRRCKTIIAIDGEADPELRFNGLMTLVRYARIDLGIKIEFVSGGSLASIRKQAANSLSAQNWAAATVSYGDGEYGRLYYIKSSITGGEQDYVKDYSSRFPDFPHQSTAEQFFNETQFEAYRALGEEIGARFCTAVVANSTSREEFTELQSVATTQSGVQIAELWATTLARGFAPRPPSQIDI